jgi:acetyl esterase/lipase
MKKQFLLALTFVFIAMFLFGCETREQSIERENRYLANNKPEAVFKYLKDVPWVEVDGETITMDISIPEGEGPFPVLMIIHGGGWTHHTNTIMEGMARYITNRGYVVFNTNYRVLPDVSMEQVVEDCFGALIWVKEHASEYKGDASRIAVTGDSAGGHLTAMIVTQGMNPSFTPTYLGNGRDIEITCAVPTYGIYDFVCLSKLSKSIPKGFLSETYKEAPERYKLLSPYHNIRKDLVPQLVIVGNADFLYAENLKYVEALETVGAPVELWMYPGQQHAFLNNYWKKNGRTGYDRMLEFLDMHLKD